jgi:anti-sigma factor RsiW
MFHPTSDEMDEYVLGRLTDAALVKTEEHLLHCSDCQCKVEILEAMIAVLREAPRIRVALRFQHETQDGIITSEVIRISRRKWLARHTGPQLDGGVTTSTLAAANAYLVDSFAQMFPEHECTEKCGDIPALSGPRLLRRRRS